MGDGFDACRTIEDRVPSAREDYVDDVVIVWSNKRAPPGVSGVRHVQR